MRRSIRGRVLLVGACILAGAGAWGQQSPSPAKQSPVSFDVALTFAPEMAQNGSANNYFWLQGGGADVVATFQSGWGFAVAVVGEHTANVTPGVDVNKLTYLVGPRYTGTVRSWKSASDKPRTLQIFGEGMLGDAHAFNTAIPTQAGLLSSANVFALQAGGGFNLALSRHFGVRLLQADYVRTALPNNTTNTQNDLHLGFGFTYRLNPGR